MSNRWTDQFRYGFTKNPVDVYADVRFGTSGSATLYSHMPLRNGQDNETAAGAQGFQGVYNVSQAVSGVLTVTLQDRYIRLVDFGCAWSGSAQGPNETWVSASFVNSGSGVVPGPGGGTVKVAFADQTGTLVNPASGTNALLHFVVVNKPGN